MEEIISDHLTNQANRWWSEFEEIIQCPVCMEVPIGKIHLCIQGHHLCECCYSKITNYLCPTCKSNINGGRSFFTENVLSKIKEIKKEIIKVHLSASINVNMDKCTTVGTQYDAQDYIPSRQFINAFKLTAAKGQFPCQISQCSKFLPHCRMIEHIRNMHAENLITSTSLDGEQFTFKFVKLKYEPCTNFDVAFDISDMVLFFLKIRLVDGNLYGSLQILNSNTVGKMFKYTLEIKGNQQTYKYEGVTKSCRILYDQLGDECLRINREQLSNMLLGNDHFTCELSIIRKFYNKNKKKEVEVDVISTKGRYNKNGKKQNKGKR